ncbi:MAG TPA: FtsX-like permease family protein, partial [Bryobacteraceae bacterium]|nr:FtsX-like permease family protein [Bryobacteraceae bacterium]
TVTANGARVRWRGALIAAEVALSMTLLTGSGLLIRSFVTLARVNPGFRADHILTAMIPASVQVAKDKAGLQRRLTEILSAVKQLPGVSAAGIATAIPMGTVNVTLLFEMPEFPGQEVGVNFKAVSPGYLAAMGTPLLRGRLLNEMDRPGAAAAVMVNEAFVRKYWPGQDPIGKQFGHGNGMTVVGLLADTKSRGLARPAEAEVIGHYRQYLGPSIGAMLVARTEGDPVGLTNAVRRAVQQLYPDQPVTDVATMEMRVADSIGEPKLYMSMLALFAGVALALTGIGIYGVVAYSAGQRTREFGIRMALGAQRSNVLGLVMGRGVGLALVGVTLGVGGAWMLSRYLETLLYGVSPGDPVAFSGAAALLILISVAACYGPARRATAIDPNVALREE